MDTAFPFLLVLGFAVVGALLFGFLGAYVARQRGRSATEGFVLALFFGPLGVIVELLLPAGSRSRAG